VGANVVLCHYGGKKRRCPLAGRLPNVGKGQQRLRARAGGPGLKFDPSAIRRRFRTR
jgi:hypothetical protein